ncbi:MAG: transporter substrate-binding protein, partial [Belnapia sp.]|nr:transporter substrate-binding protein [Belnapia sp.]
MDTTIRAGRRQLLQGAAGIAAAGLAAPAVHAQGAVTLRYVGTAVNQSREIKDKVKEDLGITLEYIPVTSDDVVRRAVTQPNSFDVLDSEYWMLKKIIPSGNLVGMDARRIKLVDEITPVFTKGEIAGKKIGDQGTAPMKVSYLPTQ